MKFSGSKPSRIQNLRVHLSIGRNSKALPILDACFLLYWL